MASRIKSAASSLCSDNQSLLYDIRKAFTMMKEIAVDMERQNKSEMVKDLEAGVIELLEAFEDCSNLLTAVESVGNMYRPNEELTDFQKLIDNGMANLKAGSSSRPQINPLLRQFKEAIWNVHHAGLPMPGDEQEDIVMTSTQCSLLNNTCPLSGKPVTSLSEPVRSMECKHIYEKNAIMQYIRSKQGHSKCPMAACPKILLAERVVCDPLLLIEIDELRTMSKDTERPNIIEDFSGDDEEESDR